MIEATTVLRAMWSESGERLERRLAGLSDEEFFWLPAGPGSPTWTVRRDATAPSGWQIDHEHPAPDPPPVPTVAWRLVHVANGNWIRWEHAFGPRRRMFPDLEVPGNAADAVDYWRASREPVTTWLTGATGADLAELRPTPTAARLPAATTIQILLDEQAHHGAEIALLRDLYRAGQDA